jgi:hypothetical protein
VDDNNSQDISQLDTIFCSVQRLKRRIQRNVRHVNNNENQNDSGLNETNRMLLDEILKLFPDLVEILMLDNIVLNRKKGVTKGVIIVDSGLMIDLVREIVRHDLYQYVE